MLRSLWIFLAAALLVVPEAAHAQATPGALTLDAALSQALAHNRALQGTRYSAEAARHVAAAAQAAWLPRVSVSESWQRGDQPVYVFSSLLSSRRFTSANFAIDALTHPDPVGSFHATAAVEQLLFDGGARRADIDASRALQDISESGTREREAMLTAQVVDTFGQLMTAQASLRAVESALLNGREDLTRANRRRDAGMATDADALAVAVHVADIEQRAIQADGQTQVLRARLNQLMGAPIEQPFELALPEVQQERTLPAMQVLLEEALAHRPELQRASAAARAADARRRSAASAFMPRVAAQAAYEVSGIRVGSRAGSWIVGGDVRWTIGVGAPERSRLRAATAEAARARVDVEEVRSQIEVDIISARRRIESARARGRVGAASVAQARESERIIRDRFDAGLLPVNDVLRAAAMVLDAHAQNSAAAVDLLTAESDLQRALGRLPSTK